MKILYNYANRRFYGSQKLNTSTGYSVGCFDTVYQYGLADFDHEYYSKNRHILDQPRGAGYWIWKYYFAKKLLSDDSIPEGSYIFYSDSGSVFVDSVDKLIAVMDRDNISVMTFRQNHLSYFWTKRDVFILMNADEPKYTHTGQRAGGWFLLKKNDDSRAFIEECYNYSLDYRICTDVPNTLGFANYGGFYDHRHDESLISIVSKKFDLFPYRNPSQHGFTDDVDMTDNMYGEEGLRRMIEKFGINDWVNKYRHYFHGESLNQYPDFFIDDKSTYPTIVELHRNPN